MKSVLTGPILKRCRTLSAALRLQRVMCPRSVPTGHNREKILLNGRGIFTAPGQTRHLHRQFNPVRWLCSTMWKTRTLAPLAPTISFTGFRLGAVGVVTDASSRDVDEIALQKVPLYLRKKGRGIRPGRNELESVNRPVDIGGVLVMPGDVVVADGDGVVVVPRKVARQVAEYAHNVLVGDKAGRRKLYEKLGIPFDPTVE
jgi:hypothetical protein